MTDQLTNRFLVICGEVHVKYFAHKLFDRAKKVNRSMV